MAFDTEFTKWLVTLGVGGVLAGFMFVFYRKDVQQYTELWKIQSDQLIAVVKDVTLVMAKTQVLLESIERNALRREDLTRLVDDRYYRVIKEDKGN